jgi:hypothetical protein
MGELCLVESRRTAAEILANNAREMATTKLVAKRFPDAVSVGGRWESPSVNTTNAKHVEARVSTNPTDRRAISLDLYTTVTPKGCDPVRVYSSNDYRLTPKHVESVFQDNPKLILKILGQVLSCQNSRTGG